MHRRILVATLVVGAALFAAPALLAWTNMARLPDFESRRPVDFPATARPLESAWTAEIGAALTDRLAGPGLGARLQGAFDYEVTNRAPGNRVLVGPDGVLYLRTTMGAPCLQDRPVSDEQDAVARLREVTDRLGMRLVVMVVPDKGAAQPDHLPDAFVDRGRCIHERALASEAAVAAVLGADAVPTIDVLQPPGSYFDQDTHWSPEGRRRAEQRLVDVLQPGMWTPDAVVATTSVRNLDLRGLMGLPAKLEVADHELAFAADTEATTLVDTDIPVVAYTSEPAPGMDLVGGSTLVVHDSFFQGWRDQFGSLFTDATFVHWGSLTQPGVADTLAGHDTIVVESVGRNVWGRGDDDDRIRQLADQLADAATS